MPTPLQVSYLHEESSDQGLPDVEVIVPGLEVGGDTAQIELKTLNEFQSIDIRLKEQS